MHRGGGNILRRWLTNEGEIRNDPCPCGSGKKYKKRSATSAPSTNFPHPRPTGRNALCLGTPLKDRSNPRRSHIPATARARISTSPRASCRRLPCERMLSRETR
ncbi:MAG: hypothetical protein EXS36_11745 [Pedosphaera sp.]|nr:hypothetical protein [Pedosphaera sp.]